MARNVTAQIFVVQQDEVLVTMNFVVGETFETDADGGAVAAVRDAPSLR